jgi:hypothetical protein
MLKEKGSVISFLVVIACLFIGGIAGRKSAGGGEFQRGCKEGINAVLNQFGVSPNEAGVNKFCERAEKQSEK